MNDLRALAARARTRWPGRAVRVLREVTSTNDVVKAAARAGEPPGLVVVANSQTSGRGRGGHGWHSPPGAGLYLSTLIDAPCDARLLQVPVVCALAVVTGLSMLARGLAIKWPNDIVTADGRKLAGILCESVARKVVVGIGVNVAVESFPAELDARAISLHTIAEAGPHDRSVVAMAILDALDDWRGGWKQLGFEAIRKVFLELTSTIGKHVECEGVRGKAIGLSADGALEILREDGALVPIHAGDLVTLS
ncbi:MAG: biotin--[acetyl-CoA-carboxylase] ligase [Deltaproteobacteria bacterium]|nr:biotin--[acetyl-CoA-carboxylase] ligase [Deltaproteobacteria bacterium]